MNKNLPQIERNNTQLLLRGVADAGLESVASCLGKDKSTVSRMREKGFFESVGKLISNLGLKVVPISYEAQDPEYVRALEAMARRYLDSRLHVGDPGEGDTWDYEE